MASTVDQHLEPYNPKPQVDNRTFHDFQRLPSEIRLYIWELALPCERFLKVGLEAQSPSGSLPHRAAAATGPRDKENKYDQIVLYGRKTIPKLLHVCRESRTAALKFYRVQIPCDHISNSHSNERAKPEGTGMLYFNPEYDILKIRPNRRRECLVDFLCLLRDRDPKNVGLLNLTMDANDFGCTAWRQLEHAKITDEARKCLVGTLSSLRQVLFMSVERAGRMYLGILQGIPGMDKYEMRRSLPIEGSVPRFERLRPDPRHIQQDLDKVYTGNVDPRNLYLHWKVLLRNLNAEPRPDVQHRLLLACDTYDQIVDWKSAKEHIASEGKLWNDGIERHKKRLPKLKVERETPEYLMTVPKTAIGFWMFPMEALEPFLELPSEEVGVDEVQFESTRHSIVDMRAWMPELAVLHLT